MAYDPVVAAASFFDTGERGARNGFEITPNDTNNLEFYASALAIFRATGDGDGVVMVIPAMQEGNETPVPLNVGEGLTIWPIAVRKVRATDTTADTIIIGLR